MSKQNIGEGSGGVCYYINPQDEKTYIYIDCDQLYGGIASRVKNRNKDTLDLVKHEVQNIVENHHMEFIIRMLNGETIPCNDSDITDIGFALHKQVLLIKRLQSIKFKDNEEVVEVFKKESDRLICYFNDIIKYQKVGYAMGISFIILLITCIASSITFFVNFALIGFEAIKYTVWFIPIMFLSAKALYKQTNTKIMIDKDLERY